MRDEGQSAYRHDDKKEIFSTRVRAGSRTYYLDIKKNSKDDDYLVISESKRVSGDDSGKQRHRVMVFAEDIEKFSNSFFKVVTYFLEHSVKVEPNELKSFAEGFDSIIDKLSVLSRYSSFPKSSYSNTDNV